MKKKIILSLAIIAILVCLFAISVSAEGRTSISYTDADGVTHNVPVVRYEDATAEAVASKLGNNATMQALFIDNGAYAILKATDGSLTAYPSWYIIEPSGGSASYVAISEVEYGYVNEKSGKTYNKGAIRYIEFPYGMNVIRQNGVFGQEGTGGYENNVTDIYIPSTVVKFDTNNHKNASFNSNKGLRRVYFELGNQIKDIPAGTFSNSGVQYIQFENLTELETIDGMSSCGLTGDLDLSKTKLRILKNGVFQNNKNIGKITLPDTLEIIENNALNDMGSAYLASPYLPSSLTYVGEKFFAYNNNLIETYIFPEGVKSIGNEPFQDSCVAGGPAGKKLNLVFLGEVTGVVYLNGNGHQKHAEEVTVYFADNSLSQYNQNGFKVKPSGSSYTDVARAIRVVFCKENNAADLIYLTNTDGTAWQKGDFVMDGHTHFGLCETVANTCGANGSETISCIICDSDIVTTLEATNNHSYVDGVCTVCGKSLCPGGGDHNIKRVVIFENGFLNVGKITSKCVVDGCTFEEKEADLEPIFVFKGYSAKINGDKMTVSYIVNNASLKAYEEINQKSISFGIVASAAQASESKPISVLDGALKVESNVVMAQVNKSYCGFDFILNGFTSEYYSKSLVMCAYVYDDGKVSYLCFNNGVAGQYESAYSVTFSEYAREEQ
ncbi:MAG: leucine-rich repeat protein [Clostridia bacterium]|nr:leucine-rich repeat protein [Clostridia bacterium]